MRCITCSHNNIAKGIRLNDKVAIFVYTGKKIIQVRAFESNIPLNTGCFKKAIITYAKKKVMYKLNYNV